MKIRFFLLSLLLMPAPLVAGNRDHCVVVLSMDGFRWDYPAKYHTPNLDRLARAGCRAESLKPSYPTKTFPNHYAIATGLYPDRNGIVQNSFYDPRFGRSFRMGDRQAVQDSIFWEGEAIWESAERQGVKTASYFWVGTESNEYYSPQVRKMYESGIPYPNQLDTVFSWLSLPEGSRPGLILFYFDEPDKTSHDFGPLSNETENVVRRLDRLVGKLAAGLAKISRKTGTDIDLIILSDHGMGTIPDGNQVFLDKEIDLTKIKRINGGNPVITLEPLPEYLDEAYLKLKSVQHLKVWKKEDLPAHYHYGTHPRIPALVVEADSAWGVEIRQRDQYSRGMHGYDPDNRDMHGIFYAKGPSFKTGTVQPTFENVNIYSLLAELLKIAPAKTDGSLGPLKGMLSGN
jgi:predicted AlkP superfamily pyrophosphatase or phosphodiesterase